MNWFDEPVHAHRLQMHFSTATDPETRRTAYQAEVLDASLRVIWRCNHYHPKGQPRRYSAALRCAADELVRRASLYTGLNLEHRGDGRF